MNNSADYKHKNVKKLGQVFLKNKDIQKKIVNLVNESSSVNLVEIGPGMGALTEHISFEGRNVFLIEIDKKLHNFLSEKYPQATVICADFLEVDIERLLDTSKSSLLFGNIPYYITSPIISKFLSSSIFSEAILMVQKELFESISSRESTKSYTSFSVLVQTLTSIHKCMNVGRFNFFPVPEVDSVVIRLVKKKDCEVKDYLREFSSFLKKSFFMPRKTINNNWRKFLSPEVIAEIAKEVNLDLKTRPDAISPEQYQKIFLCKAHTRHIKAVY